MYHTDYKFPCKLAPCAITKLVDIQMKITFQRWESSEPEETLPIRAVTSYGETLNVQNGPIEWSGPNSALGKIDDIKLDGTYLLKFDFQESELRSWLKNFITENPAYSVQLLAEAHAALLISAENDRKRRATRKKPI